MTLGGWLGKARVTWDRARTSLWFIPSLLVVVALALSTVMVEVDQRFGNVYGAGWWIFGGNAEGARTVLSVVAGSLITVVAVVFSVTMIAIQQASTQFTPRVLRNFTRDRGNQWVLGIYISTFSYALLVLRRVRGAHEGGDAFVPSLSISVAMLLALVSLGSLIYFIHHASETMQVSYLLSTIRGDLDRELDKMFPRPLLQWEESVKLDETDSDHCELAVECDREGYLRYIKLSELGTTDGCRVSLVRIEVQIGDYVRPGDAIARVWTEEPPGEGFVDRIRGAFTFDRDRSMEQDPRFGIQQIVDIGVKALSPGINDPTTAEQAVDYLGGAMVLLLERAMPSPLQLVSGDTRVLVDRPTFEDMVVACFAQIRRAARVDYDVSLSLMRVLGRLVEDASPSRGVHLQHQIDEVVAGFDHDLLTTQEQLSLMALQRRTRASRPAGSRAHGTALPA